MHHRTYNYVYIINMLVILVLLLAFNLSDFWQMLLGGYAIILTSIFTYSNRHGISRKKRPKNNK